jgi:predicted esterase
MRRVGVAALSVVVMAIATLGGALARADPPPGPAILYWPPAVAPELTNTGPWQAPPILISGATAYRDGEFLYQDFLYDDHGARLTFDPSDPRAQGDTFSKPNGTYTYPTGPGYANDAADLVEFRVKPLARATAFRITLNTLENPALVAFSIAIGGRPGHTFSFPDGANVRAPAELFLSVHPDRHGRMTADLMRAGSDRRITGPAPRVRVDLRRRQIEVDVPHADWNPGRRTVRLAMGVGLWNQQAHRYLLPGAVASATQPGGAGLTPHPAAFFNVAFRSHEPLSSLTAGPQVVLNAAFWRDRDQGTALAKNDISSLFADVNFGELARRITDNSDVPRTGPMDRILASHFEITQGAQFSNECGFNGARQPSSCVPEYEGQLQPYAVYVPAAPPAHGGYGLTLLLHSLSANYNQYMSMRNQWQFANRALPSIVLTSEARGPDQFYEGYGAADVFEAWADVARHYPLNPAYTDITGYSMGGIGTFKLASQFPDLFARAQPTVGDESNNDVLASLRNLPVLMWNNSADELVNPLFYGATATKLASLGYRYELDVFQPCYTSQQPAKCSPVIPNHNELAINDQFAPAAAFLGSAEVDPHPAHVTYVLDAARDRPKLGLIADHAYWVSGLTLRSPQHTSYTGDPEGEIDVFSHGFGQSDPVQNPLQAGTGTLTGGNLGPLHYLSTSRSWGPAASAPLLDVLDLTATNIATASIDVTRARVDCHVLLNIHSDGPITITLPGCNRTVQSPGTSPPPLP